MRIVITHLTRMQEGVICVAGIDPATGQHVRPVSGRLSVNLLRGQGGVFDVGAIVDLDGTKSVGSAPEVEDHLFNIRHLQFVGMCKPKEFWEILSDASETKLRAIFGKGLEQHGNGCAVDPGTGIASLGCIRPDGPCSIEVNRFDKVRLTCSDGRFDLDLGVTDLRVYEDDHKTPHQEIIGRISEKLEQDEDLLICVGLARAWQKPSDTQQRHWLQVNNLHFADDPLGTDLR